MPSALLQERMALRALCMHEPTVSVGTVPVYVYDDR